MEIKINIPMNDYKEPTEVRQDVVQCICEHIVGIVKKGIIKRLEVPICDDLLTKVYIDKRNDSVSILSTFCSVSENKDKIIVRGCEMQAAFDALCDAEYYISSAWETETKHVYYFTNRFDKHDKHIRKFTDFID